MLSECRVDQRVSALIAKQRGVITTKQLLEAGLDADRIGWSVSRGLLTRLARGVYRSSHVRETWELWTRAACLLNGPGAALSHAAAAHTWPLSVPKSVPASAEITIPAPRRANSIGGRVVVHVSRSFRASDRAHLGDLVVTTAARTIADLAPRLTSKQLALTLNDAIQRQLTSPCQLLSLLARPPRRRPGRQAILRALDPWVGDSVPESVAEAEFLRVLERWGIKRPICQYKVVDRGVFVARIDFAWPERLLAVEVDGYRYHSGPDSFASDSHRANRLAALGWTVLRTTPLEVAESEVVVARAVMAHLDSSGGDTRTARR